MNILAVAGAVTGISIPIAIIILLVGYVNRDAKRREMNSTLWTILIVVLIPAYFVTGFIFYFLLRDPLPLDCPQCDATVSARFNYCPDCKFNLRPHAPSVPARFVWQTGFAAIAPLSWRDIHRRSRRLVLRRPAPSAEESNPRPL